jgi:hypothetical protein
MEQRQGAMKHRNEEPRERARLGICPESNVFSRHNRNEGPTVKQDRLTSRRPAKSWILKFDVRYRRRRFNELVHLLKIDFSKATVLDASPQRSRLMDAIVRTRPLESDASAMPGASHRHQLSQSQSRIHQAGTFDFAIYSDSDSECGFDEAAFNLAWRRLRPGGLFFAFVPLSHTGRRANSGDPHCLDSIRSTITQKGFRIVHAEGGMHVDSPLWTPRPGHAYLGWPIVKSILRGVRFCTLSLIPYKILRRLNRLLGRRGVNPKQGVFVALKPSDHT